MEIGDIFNFDLLAVTVYLFCTLVITEIVKEKELLSNIKPLYISWVVGVLIFLAIHFFNLYDVTFIMIVQYTFLTLILNVSYKTVKTIWRRVKELRG